MNYKGLLQEWSVKNNFPIPIYSETPIGTGIEMTWKVTCTFLGKTFSAITPNKKLGHQTVAQKILEAQGQLKKEVTKRPPKKKILVTKPPPPSPSPPKAVDRSTIPRPPPEGRQSKLVGPSTFDGGVGDEVGVNPLPSRKIAIIIDLENVPKFPSEIADLVSDGNLAVFSVCSKHYHGSTTEEIPGITKVLSPTLGPDSSDACIMVLLGSLLATGLYEEYLLVSRDRFVAPLVPIGSIGTEPSMWVPKPVKVVSTRDQLVKEIY